VSGLTLDAGALIAVDRGSRHVAGLLRRAIAKGHSIAVPAGALGQAWRDGARQARIALLIASPAVTVEAMDSTRARAAGVLCGVTQTSDVIDASVALCARARRHTVVTSDPGEIRRLDPTLTIEPC
jgi:hypothetical protein